MTARLQNEITVLQPIGPGKGPGQKLVQELLALHGVKLLIDGDWGPATGQGVRLVLPGASFVDQAGMNKLAAPILRAVAPVKPLGTLAETLVATALQHLAQHPIEVGGQNAGPFVREYMDGMEGPQYPWCMGFVTYAIRQAVQAMELTVPAHLKRTYSCDVFGDRARLAEKLVPATSLNVTPGAIFLVRGARANDWVHTGLIVGVDKQTVTTIEGNTNDEGSREGYEVCRRIRNRANLDAVLL